MPIRWHHRWLYPIDWRELSASIRFRCAKGRCEGCGQPHGRDGADREFACAFYLPWTGRGRVSRAGRTNATGHPGSARAWC